MSRPQKNNKGNEGMCFFFSHYFYASPIEQDLEANGHQNERTASFLPDSSISMHLTPSLLEGNKITRNWALLSKGCGTSSTMLRIFISIQAKASDLW